HVQRSRARRPRQHDWNARRGSDPRRRRVRRADAVRCVVGSGGRVRPAADRARRAAAGSFRQMKFWSSCAVALLAAIGLAATLKFEYFFFAGYTVLMFIVLATAWNILGGYAGYVNFGTPAFFGLRAYTAAVLFHAFERPLALQIVAAATMSGLLGLGAGLLTLRLRGIFFAIATIEPLAVMATSLLTLRSAV